MKRRPAPARERITKAYARYLEKEMALLPFLQRVPEAVARAALRVHKGRNYTGYWLVHDWRQLGGISLNGVPAELCRTKKGKAQVLLALKHLESWNRKHLRKDREI
jgi:hypothetical protein